MVSKSSTRLSHHAEKKEQFLFLPKMSVLERHHTYKERQDADFSLIYLMSVIVKKLSLE